MRVTRRFNWTGAAGLTAASAALALMIIAVVMDLLPRFSFEHGPKTDEAARRRYGEIIIPGDRADQCRYLQFDNQTGIIREGSANRCRGQLTPDDLDRSEDRINAIRRAFSER